MNKKILSVLVFSLFVLGATKAFASLTFSSAAITGDAASTIDVGAGNALSLQTTNNGAITTGTGLVTLGGSLNAAGIITLPMTTSSTTGVIYKGATPFIHNFNFGNNGTVTTDGKNTFVGINAGNFTMGSTATLTYESSSNVGIGQDVLTINTKGYGNTATGWSDLKLNTTGSWNTAYGVTALYNNTTGSNNVAIGGEALGFNTIGGENTAVGVYALDFNTTGSLNTANGMYSLSSNSTGSRNVALGYAAGAYELGSSSFYVDAYDRANTAGDKAGALLYGTFNATPSLQTLTINGKITASNAMNKGTVALSAGTATVTVVSGAVCVVSETTTATNGVKGAVVGTTLTITGTGTDTIAYICL
ncbi:MAG: hypothetical protein WC793_00250 [Candidatus Paceibacterota bacterium]|jgi:hypothetical protein